MQVVILVLLGLAIVEEPSVDGLHIPYWVGKTGSCHTKGSLKALVVFIPKEGWVHAASPILLLV